jgi:hypothetical protein
MNGPSCEPVPRMPRMRQVFMMAYCRRFGSLE